MTDLFDLGKSKKKKEKELDEPEQHTKREKEPEHQLFQYETLIPWIVTTAFAFAINDIFFAPAYDLVHFIVTGENVFTLNSIIALIISVSLMFTIGISLNKVLKFIRRKKASEG